MLVCMKVMLVCVTGSEAGSEAPEAGSPEAGSLEAGSRQAGSEAGSPEAGSLEAGSEARAGAEETETTRHGDQREGDGFRL